MDKRHFNKNEITYILYEYLGINKEMESIYFNMEQLKKDIEYIISMYKNDNRHIEYMLESDFELGFASDNFDRNIGKYTDIDILENKNGIIIYYFK